MKEVEEEGSSELRTMLAHGEALKNLRKYLAQSKPKARGWRGRDLKTKRKDSPGKRCEMGKNTSIYSKTALHSPDRDGKQGKKRNLPLKKWDEEEGRPS